MQCNAMQCNAMQRNAMQRNATQCNAMQRNATQCNATQCNAMQRNAMQCNAMQRNATQCNATQRNATQHNTMQCNAMQHFCNVFDFDFVLLRSHNGICFFQVIQDYTFSGTTEVFYQQLVYLEPNSKNFSSLKHFSLSMEETEQPTNNCLNLFDEVQSILDAYNDTNLESIDFNTNQN